MPWFHIQECMAIARRIDRTNPGLTQNRNELSSIGAYELPETL